MTAKSELALFDDPSIQQSIESVWYHEIHPTYKINDNVEFFCKGSPSDYVDVNESTINVKLKLTYPTDYKETDTPVIEKKCFLENMTISSLF